MLTKLKYEDIPGIRGRENPNTKFANRTIREFLELSCDAAEVTGFPMDGVPTPTKVGSLNSAIKKANGVHKLRVATRNGRIYLVRKK